MIADGRLAPQLLDDRILSAEACQGMNFPEGTHSQYVRYWNEHRRWIVEVHRYLRPDGSLAASGRPDPKKLRLGGVLYIKV